MQNEHEVAIVVESPAAEMEARVELAEVHGETAIAIAEIEAAASVERVEAQTEAAVAEAHAHDDRLDALVAGMEVLRGEVAALREAAVVTAAAVVEVAAEVEVDEIETPDVAGEVPASVESAEAQEPAPLETPPETLRKRHFVRL